MFKSRLTRLWSIFLLAIALIGFPASHASAGGALTVTVANEGSDANPGDGFCATGSGSCTLRAAIQEANAHAGADNIIFSLPGSGVHVISITSGALPVITEQLNLDGTSQPNCVVPCIVLSGASLAGLNNGLAIGSDNNIIKGFIITSWSNAGIFITGNNNVIQANDIGFWPGNPMLLPNGAGISLFGTGNIIGGTTAAGRNVISGNTYQGITVANGSIPTSANMIIGNRIGTNAAGNSALGNGSDGISVYAGSTSLTIGGTSASTRNVISGNHGNGIYSGGANTIIQGNFIGLNAAGTGALGNTYTGILLSGVVGNKIGGTLTGTGNRIAYNGKSAILVTGATAARNSIRRNSIYENTDPGIDLGFNGITPNDTLDPDLGPNGLQNFPRLTSAVSSTRVISGMLRSKANKTYALDFFSSPTCDPSGYGEGKTFLGSLSISTTLTGSVTFSYAVPVNFPIGYKITATATDLAGNTSEFSRCYTAN